MCLFDKHVKWWFSVFDGQVNGKKSLSLKQYLEEPGSLSTVWQTRSCSLLFSDVSDQHWSNVKWILCRMSFQFPLISLRCWNGAGNRRLRPYRHRCPTCWETPRAAWAQETRRTPQRRRWRVRHANNHTNISQIHLDIYIYLYLILHTIIEKLYVYTSSQKFFVF